MASDTVSMRRSAKRRRPRKNRVGRRIFITVFLIVLLILAGAYYSTKYVQDLKYAQYPLYYQDLIEKYAGVYDLEPEHIAAVIRCESSFRAQAKSNVGALGLMQIMPDTGGWIAGKLNERDTYDPSVLADPDTNLRYGCWYLKWLLDRYNGDKLLVSAAYHAGQGTVDKWLQDGQYSEDGVALVTIPSSVTSDYTEKVLTAYEKYKELYTFAQAS